MADHNDDASNNGALEIVSDKQADAGGERISIRAEVTTADGRSLDPQKHDSEAAREIAAELCEALTGAYAAQDAVRPETLAISVQTVLETLLSGIEKEGVDTTTMRVALANSVLSNGRATVKIDVSGEPMTETEQAVEQNIKQDAEPSSGAKQSAGKKPTFDHLMDLKPGVTIH